MKIEKENKVERMEKVFIVSRRNSKFVRTERIKFDFFGCDILGVFPNRKNAEKWIKYWEYGKDKFDILERKLY